MDSVTKQALKKSGYRFRPPNEQARDNSGKSKNQDDKRKKHRLNEEPILFWDSETMTHYTSTVC